MSSTSNILPPQNARIQARHPRLPPQSPSNDDDLPRCRRFLFITSPTTRQIRKLENLTYALQHLDLTVIEHDTAFDAVDLEFGFLCISISFSVFIADSIASSLDAYLSSSPTVIPIASAGKLRFPAYAA